MKNVVLLGSAGSIGTSTIKVAQDLPDRIKIVGLATGSRVDDLAQQANAFLPEAVSIQGEDNVDLLRSKLNSDIPVYSGDE